MDTLKLILSSNNNYILSYAIATLICSINKSLISNNLENNILLFLQI